MSTLPSPFIPALKWTAEFLVVVTVVLELGIYFDPPILRYILVIGGAFLLAYLFLRHTGEYVQTLIESNSRLRSDP